jgi:hypothetical protein
LSYLHASHLGHDEALLEVGMDPACRLRRLGPLQDGPGLHLIRAGSEEVLQLQCFVALEYEEQLFQ